MTRKTWMMAVALAAVVFSACGESASAPSDDAGIGSAAFARNPTESPGSPDKNNSCENNESGNKTRNSPKDKNQCGGPLITWTVTTSGMDGNDYVNICYPRDIRLGSATWSTLVKICVPSDEDYQRQITTDGDWISTFSPPNADATYFVATPYRNTSSNTGDLWSGGTLGAEGDLLTRGGCLFSPIDGRFYWNCIPDTNNIGEMSYSFLPPE